MLNSINEEIDLKKSKINLKNYEDKYKNSKEIDPVLSQLFDRLEFWRNQNSEKIIVEK